MHGQAAALRSWEAAIFQRESPLRMVMLEGCTRGRSSVVGTTSMAPGWRRFGSEMPGLEARSSFQREPLPRWRRASFQRESPGWMRISLARRLLFTIGATEVARGARDGRAGRGFDGSSKFGAAAGGEVRTAGARGAKSESGVVGFGGAEKFGDSGARLLGSDGEKLWREKGSRREGAILGSTFAFWRGCEFGETRGATGCTGAANEGCERSKGKRDGG